MGCTIHLIVEKKDKEGNWQLADDEILVDCGMCLGTGIFAKNTPNEKDCWNCVNGKENGLKYDYRNYLLFSILANVRNNSDWGYIEPICNPRGIPSDASSEYLSFDIEGIEEWQGYHSHSYHTLKELKEYNWENKVIEGNLKKYDPSLNKIITVESLHKTETAKEAAGFFYTGTMLALQKLANECGGDENVRIVFCFDN